MPKWLSWGYEQVKPVASLWGLMSGALSVPFALLAAFGWVGSRHLFLILAYLSMWVLVVSMFRRNAALFDKMKPKLEITYDEDRECKTILEPPRSPVPLVYLRLIISTKSIPEITGCQGHLVQIDHGGKKIWSGVNLLLSFAPAEDLDATNKTIRTGNTYHLDVAIVSENSEVRIENATRIWPAHFHSLKQIFSDTGDYFLTISVAGARTVPTIKRVRLNLAKNYRDCFLEVL